MLLPLELGYTIVLLILNFFFLHLVLQHFFQLLPRLWIPHLHLCDQLAQWNSATLQLSLFFIIDWQLNIINICL